MRLILSSVVLGTSLLAGALAGCDGEQGLGPIAREHFIDETFKAECAFMVRCTLLPDQASCGSATSLDRAIFELIENVQEGTVRYNSERARDFVDALANRKCQNTIAAERAIEAAFEAIFDGEIGQGGPCLLDQECTGDSVCDRTACQDGPQCCPGACAPRPQPVGVGGDCSSLDCVDSAYCFEAEDGTRVCKARPGSGESCDGPGTCQDGMQCDPNGDKCYRLSAAGGKCNPGLAEACLDYSHWCSPDSNTCVPLPEAGAACGINGALCALYAFCDADGGGTCQPRGIAGQGCGGSQDCMGDLDCRDGACAPPDPPSTCQPPEPE